MPTLRQATIRLAHEDEELRPLLLPLLKAAEDDEDEDEKEGKFERGEDVPLSEMPKKLQDNAKNPPPSVQKVKEKIKSKSKKGSISEQELFDAALKLASESPEYEEHLLPVLEKFADSVVPGDPPNPSDERANEMGWDPGKTEDEDEGKKAADLDDERALLHGAIKLATDNPDIRDRLLPAIREATVLPLLDEDVEMLRQAKGPAPEAPSGSKWEKMPKGWTAESRKKFWESLTAKAPKHKVTECMKRMEGKVDDTGAFCASLADRVVGKKWRSESRKKADDEWLGIEEVRELCPSCADRMASYNMRVVKASVIRRAVEIQKKSR